MIIARKVLHERRASETAPRAARAPSVDGEESVCSMVSTRSVRTSQLPRLRPMRSLSMTENPSQPLKRPKPQPPAVPEKRPQTKGKPNKLAPLVPATAPDAAAAPVAMVCEVAADVHPADAVEEAPPPPPDAPPPVQSPPAVAVAVAVKSPVAVKPKPAPPPSSSGGDGLYPVISIRQIALGLLQNPPNPDKCGTAVVKCNHYTKSFPIYNGVLKWEDVDEEYSFSFVYNGPYTRNIFELLPVDPLTNKALGGPKVMRDDEGDYFVGLKPHKDYEVIVSQDEGTAAAK